MDELEALLGLDSPNPSNNQPAVDSSLNLQSIGHVEPDEVAQGISEGREIFNT